MRASATEILFGLIQVCSDEEMLSSVLAIESIVMMGSKDPTGCDAFIRESIADAEIVNTKLREARDALP